MKVTSIRVGVDLKINLGNYQSIDFHGGMEAELEDGDDPTASMLQLMSTIRTQLAAQAAHIAQHRLDTQVQILKDNPKIANAINKHFPILHALQVIVPVVRNPETDEISPEDLEAAGDFYDRLVGGEQ